MLRGIRSFHIIDLIYGYSHTPNYCAFWGKEEVQSIREDGNSGETKEAVSWGVMWMRVL